MASSAGTFLYNLAAQYRQHVYCIVLLFDEINHKFLSQTLSLLSLLHGANALFLADMSFTQGFVKHYGKQLGSLSHCVLVRLAMVTEAQSG